MTNSKTDENISLPSHFKLSLTQERCVLLSFLRVLVEVEKIDMILTREALATIFS